MKNKQYQDEAIKEFLKELEKVSPSYGTNQVFKDVCRIISLSLRGAIAQGQEKTDIEEQYQGFVKKYGTDGMKKVCELFSIVVEALEANRTDFLGQVYERLNATVKNFGQFLTPICVAELMSKITLGQKIEDGGIVRICDPTCGAGVLLLECARQFIEAGGKQRNLLIYADDLDETAACIAYIQFSLLGYAAIVRRMDSLANKVYEGPWYTIGYFLHAFPMRMLCQNVAHMTDSQKNNGAEEQTADMEKQGGDKPSVPPADSIDIRSLVQGELF